jgi:hypothetical protein
MSELIKKIIKLVCKLKIGGWLISKIIILGRVLEFQYQKRNFDEQKYKKELGTIVLNGYFKGMEYPFTKSLTSSYFPKIIGSYEFELNNVWETIFSRKFSTYIDIGCAEGYYAVGMGRKNPDSKILAFDTNSEAITLCKELAAKNNVNNIIYGSSINAVELGNVCNEQKDCFILCDVDGYEKYLFNSENINSFRNTTLLIETHDLFDIEITGYLKSVFNATHELTIIKSIDDIEKAYTYGFGMNYDLLTKKILFCEGRMAIQEWFYLAPKTSLNITL